MELLILVSRVMTALRTAMLVAVLVERHVLPRLVVTASWITLKNVMMVTKSQVMVVARLAI